jgi:hypothetical protein
LLNSSDQKERRGRINRNASVKFRLARDDRRERKKEGRKDDEKREQGQEERKELTSSFGSSKTCRQPAP